MLDMTGALLENTDDNKALPMRVVLISNIGEMFTVLLPSYADGRYRFTNSAGVEVFPFYFEFEDGNWVASLERGARFFRMDSKNSTEFIGKKQVLKSMSFYRLQYNSGIFYIYAETEQSNDHVFLPYYFEERTDYTIGRTDSNMICYKNGAVSREHAVLHWNGKGWTIIDKNSTNGTYVNGRKVSNADLKVGDIVFIVGLYMIIGTGYIAINNANNRIGFNTPKIRHITGENDISFSNPSENDVNYDFYDRKPRKIKKVDPKPIDIESPPAPIGGNNLPLLLRLGSPALMGGRALMTGNIFMAMTSMVMPALTQGLTEKDRKEYEKKRVEGYREYLQYISANIQEEKENEENHLNYNYPPLNTNLKMVTTKKRLWDRRKNNDDFLDVRLGYGSYPMIAELNYRAKTFQIEKDFLEDEMYQIAERPVYLENVPVMHSFVENFVTGISGRRDKIRRLISNIILQLVANHSYDEMKIVILVDNDEAQYFDFLRYLPHCWNDDQSFRFFVTSQSEAQQFTNYLNNEFEETDNSSSKKYSITKGASYVIFALSKDLFDHVELLEKFISSDDYQGVSVVAAFDGFPKECRKVIDLQQENCIIDYYNPEIDNQEFEMDDCDPSIMDAALKKLGETKLRTEDDNFMLPNMVTFLDMYNVGKVEHLNPLKRWEENNPIKSLAAPVGIGTDGKLFNLDLHEKRQGPHGLVAGMTGSGKSEFLITYILSMAVNYSPDEVAFVLIDYKGGGLADAFVDAKRGIYLPHVVGTITNLDGAAINRSLMSIKSELKRRQAVFKKAKSETNEGTMDIYDYQKLYRSKKVSEPMPHLFIISDEFAELKSQQPEFMNELISTARIGRSLGVHLILATQKPSGVVNDQIRSNTKFQVCLRVQDKSDSMDMIKRPDAAELKQTGRFYLQVGYNEFFAQGQSAWCGAEYAPQDEVVQMKDLSVCFVDNIGQVLHKTEPKLEKISTGTKQIVAIVKYLSDLAVRENIVPRKLWIEPLPAKIDYDNLKADYPECGSEYLKIPVGMVDDPIRQQQYPYVIDWLSINHMILYGASGGGKSTFMKTMLLSLVERYTPEDLNYYIIDLSSGALNPFKKVPHCGAYLTENNEMDIDHLFDMVNELIEERKKLFAEEDVTNFNSYIQIKKLPTILIIIDGFPNIKTLHCKKDYYSTLHEYVRNSTNYGIKFVLTVNNVGETTQKTKQEIDYKVALQAKDKYVYMDMLDVKCQVLPPNLSGRGLCVINGETLEYQIAMTNPFDAEQSQATKLRERLADISEKCKDSIPARMLPSIPQNETYEKFCQNFTPGSIPLGYYIQTVQKISIPLQQLHSISCYFGNPAGIKPVLENMIEAGRKNQMDLCVLRRQSGTVFDANYEAMLRSNYYGNVKIIDTTPDGLVEFDEYLVSEISKRNVFRDEFCRINNIPATDKGRVKRASRFIRERSKSIMVLFESYGDFCRLEKDDSMVAEMTALLSKTQGYNIYFVGCFYPNEEDLTQNNPMLKCFNQEEVCLLFGGQYDKQCAVRNLSMDLRKFNKPNPNYDKYILKYRDEYYSMHMPCGELNNNFGDPEEASIL